MRGRGKCAKFPEQKKKLLSEPRKCGKRDVFIARRMIDGDTVLYGVDGFLMTASHRTHNISAKEFSPFFFSCTFFSARFPLRVWGEKRASLSAVERDFSRLLGKFYHFFIFGYCEFLFLAEMWTISIRNCVVLLLLILLYKIFKYVNILSRIQFVMLTIAETVYYYSFPRFFLVFRTSETQLWQIESGSHRFDSPILSFPELNLSWPCYFVIPFVCTQNRRHYFTMCWTHTSMTHVCMISFGMCANLQNSISVFSEAIFHSCHALKYSIVLLNIVRAVSYTNISSLGKSTVYVCIALYFFTKSFIRISSVT